MSEWADDLHAAFFDLIGFFNRPEPDAALIAAAGIKLDRALFPLLVRIGLKAPVSVVELGHISGRDHSTVSRQVKVLEELGLVERQASPHDQRVRLLKPSAEGRAMLKRLTVARRAVMEDVFAGWSEKDRAAMLKLLQRAVKATAEVGRKK
tara:strand:- start:3240 stop:3692 length:453 start_codon:yes stop_codon:yes gene_type:complete